MHEIPSNADSANVIFLFAKTHGNKKCKALRIAGFLFENSWKEVRGTFKNSFQKIGCDALRCGGILHFLLPTSLFQLLTFHTKGMRRVAPKPVRSTDSCKAGTPHGLKYFG